jgi:hypothetical protein
MVVNMVPVQSLAQQYPAQWLKCKIDGECVAVFACGHALGINKNYLDQYQKKFAQGCDASAWHDPNTMAVCIDNQCVATISNKKR